MQSKTLAATGVAAGVLALAGGLLLARPRTGGRGNDDDAPGRTARRDRFGDYAVVGKTVTVSKPPREQVFAFWRDFTNLPRFMENLESVEQVAADRSRWTILAPGGTVVVETRIAEERAGELIAWRSVEGSAIDTEGRVKFRDAPGGRGTEVELVVAYVPPLGRVGQAVAKLLQRDPAIQARRDLRRFKMLMETGEVANSDRRLKLEEA